MWRLLLPSGSAQLFLLLLLKQACGRTLSGARQNETAPVLEQPAPL
jgi:hypothetical protein